MKLKLLLCCSVLLLSACASKHMAPVLDVEKPVIASADEAVVVFMRPSDWGGGVQSSVFDVTSDENKLVGIVSSNTKVAYAVSPGEKTFMVVSEAADFAKADVEAGKTYYVLVTPRMGWWKARFSLRPLMREQLDGKDFADWFRQCGYVKNTAASLLWAQENALDIQQKRVEYYLKWQAKPEMEKPRLNPTDGVVTTLNAQ